MRCEICGRPIQGSPHRILVDTATLLVCSRCARYGVPVSQRPKPKLTVPTAPLPRKADRDKLPEIVPDYDSKIRKAREEMGLTQEVLAKYVGEKVSVIKRIEMGKLKPTIELAKKLEKVLKVTLLSDVASDVGVSVKERKVEVLLGDVVVIKDKGRKEEA